MSRRRKEGHRNPLWLEPSMSRGCRRNCSKAAGTTGTFCGQDHRQGLWTEPQLESRNCWKPLWAGPQAGTAEIFCGRNHSRETGRAVEPGPEQEPIQSSIDFMKLPIMIVVIVLSSFAIMASAQPVSTNAPPPLSEQGALQTRTIQTTEATIQKLEAQVSGTNPQKEEQPQPGIPNIPAPHGGSHFLPFLQYYPWSPVGGSPLMIPMQMSGQGSQPSNQATLPQQPLIFPPYGYFPLLSPPYRNQLVSPYGFPMTFDAPLPQIPASNPPISPQTPSGSGPAVKSPQPSQQTQNLPVVYMLQQPVNSLLGGLSSEELEMAARAGQLSLYLSAVQTAQRMSQDTSNPAQPAFQQPSPVVLPTAGITSTGVSKAHGLHPERGSEALSKTHAIPAGLEKAGQAAATIQAPAQNQNRQAAQPCLRPHAPNKN